MKSIKYTYVVALALGFIMLMSSHELKASHIMGGDITYTCLGGNTYMLQLRLFRDCNGASLGTNNQTVTITAPNCGTQTVSLPLVAGYPIIITPLCANQIDRCNSAAGTYGVEEYLYKGPVTLNCLSANYTMSWSLCCRNNAINTLNPPTQNTYISSDLNNALTPCNNSPDFLNSPVAFFCVNELVNYNHGASDPENDNLVFSLVNCQTGNNNSVVYQAPYNATSPLATASGITIDPTTGGMQFTPTQQQVGVVCVLVEEYRNGVKIGEVVRDMQFTIISCNNDLPKASGINGTASSSGTTGPFTLTVCAGDTIDFNIATFDNNILNPILPQPPQNVTLNWNGGITGATFTSNGATQPTGHFYWIPQNANKGNNLFTIDVRDDGCPISGVNIYSFLINVKERPILNTGNAQVTCSPGDLVNLNATYTTTTSQSASFSWTPTTGLGTPNAQATTASPMTTQVYTALATYTNGCQYADSVIVEVTDGLTLPHIPDTTICQGPVQLDASLPPVTNTLLFTDSTSITIPDNDAVTGVYSSIMVSGVSPYAMGANTIESVCVNIPHQWSADMEIYLISPDGILMELSTGNGGGTQNSYTNTCFVPTGAASVVGAGSPLTGNYLPEGTFSVFTNSATNGEWKLWVRDVGQFFTGSISNWSIKFKDPNTLTYSWTPSATLSCSNCADPIANTNTTTTYVVTATNQNGCVDMDTVTIFVIDTIQAPIIACSGVTPNSLVFCWDTVVAAAGYEVNVDNGGWITPNGPGGLCHTVTGLMVTQTVNIQVRATGTCTNSVILIGTQSCTTIPCTVVGALNSQTNVSCNGGNNGAITVTSSGGTLPHVFSIDGGITTQPTGTFTNLTAGNYTITVIDSFSCTSTVAVTITQPTALTSAMTTTPVSCNGGNDGTATVAPSGGTGPYNVVWNTTSTNPTITGLTAGTYTVTITDANSCQTTNTVTVLEPLALAITSVSTDVSCNGAADGSVTATVTGGNGGNTFVWTGAPSTTNIASSLNGGIYTVNVTDSKNCTIAITDTVNENTAVVLGQTTIPALCNASADGMAIVTATGGTGTYTYLWAANAASQVTDTAFNLVAGTYTVTVTDSDNCFKTITATVTSPPAIGITMSSMPTSCDNTTDGTATVVASGGTAPYSYAWANSSDTTPTASNLGSGFQAVTVTGANGCTITDSVQVLSPPAITIGLTPTPASCSGVADGAITATVTGGAGGYSYAWSGTADVTPTVTSLLSGTHTLTVTDMNGCTETATTTITEPVSLTITLDSVDVSCFNGSDGSATVVTMGGTLPYLFNWSPSNATTPTAANLSAGYHTVTVTDANNCQAVDSIFVNQPATGVSTAMAFTPLLCNGDASGTATVTASGGSGTYTYSWSHNAALNNATATGLQAGNYTVTVADGNGCDYVDNITVTEPTALATSMSMTPTSCNGYADGTAAVVVTGGVGGYLYNWVPTGGNNDTATALLAGLYGVSITDANGCLIADTITVTQPAGMTLTMSMTPVSCHSGTDGTASVAVIGGTGIYTYDWSASSSTIGTATNLSASWHSVTVTDANGCFKIDSIEVTEPDTLTVAFSAIDVSCFGGADGQATVTPTGGVGNYTYSWMPSGQTNATATNLLTGSQVVTVTDGNGCIATGSVFVSQPSSGVTTSMTMTSVLCSGGNTGTAKVVAVGGAGNYTYLWNNNQTTATATNLAAGTYTVTVTDQNGCFTVDNIAVDEPSPIQLIVGQIPTSCYGGSDGRATVVGSGGVPNAQGSYTFTWNTSPVQYNTATAVGLTGGQTYTVTAQDENGCTATANVTINQPTAIQLTTTQTNVTCNGFTDGTASVLASGGTPGFSYAWSNGDATATATDLPYGSYTVTVTDFKSCVKEIDVTITEPAELSVTSIVEDVICKGESTGKATVLAAGGTPWYGFTWSANAGGQTTNELENLAAGAYTVTMNDANGCLIEHTLTVGEPAQALSAISNAFGVSCYGDRDGEISISATGGAIPYKFSKDGQSYSNSNILVGLQGGQYPIFVKDDVGCIFTDTLTVSEPAEFTVDLGADLNADYGVGVSLVPTTQNGQVPFFYSWTPADSSLNCAACPVPIATPAETQLYELVITDVNGCQASDDIIVNIMKERIVYVATGFTPNGDGTNDYLFVQGGEHSDKVLSFKVYDRWGETVFLSEDTDLNAPEQGWNGQFKGDFANSGVYGWIAEIEFADGEIIIFKGNTTLVR